MVKSHDHGWTSTAPSVEVEPFSRVDERISANVRGDTIQKVTNERARQHKVARGVRRDPGASRNRE